MAKKDQKYRSEQSHGGIHVRHEDNLPPGLYEQYERVHVRSKPHIFDGQTLVTRDKNIDIITGEPIFTKNVHFTSNEDVLKSTNRRLHFAKLAFGARSSRLSQQYSSGETIFNEIVESHVLAIFEGLVMFAQTSI
jgi:hypothetical protein